MIIAFVAFSWINHACYLHGANSAPSVSVPSGHLLCGGFVTLNPTKLGFLSIHKYFLSLISWVLPGILVHPCRVARETLLLSLMLPRTADLVCPDAEHAAATSGASCEAAASIWAEKEDSSGAAGLLLRDRSLLSRGCPPCHLMVQNSTVQDCKLLSAPFAMSDPQ